MLCDIYQSANAKKVFVFVAHGQVPLEKLPAELKQKLGVLNLFKTADINIGDPLIGGSPAEILADIQKQGYALQGAEIKITVSEVGAALGAGILAASMGAAFPVTAAVSAVSFLVAHAVKDQGENK